MKNILIILTLMISQKVLSQVTKADFDAAFIQFPFEKMEKIIINNVHVYYTDGTNRWSYYSYKTETTSVEIKNNSFYIKSYSDNTKSKATNYYIIPFEKMTSISVGETQISIQLVE